MFEERVLVTTVEAEKENILIYEAENVEAEKMTLAAVNAYHLNRGPFLWVTWKDEGDSGPTYIAVEGYNPPEGVTSIPFGPPCTACGWPEGMHSRSMGEEGLFYLGWWPREQAQSLAEWAGVKLETQ